MSTWGRGCERIDSEDACAISSVSNNLPLPQPPPTTSRTPPTRPGSVSMTQPPGAARAPSWHAKAGWVCLCGGVSSSVLWSDGSCFGLYVTGPLVAIETARAYGLASRGDILALFIKGPRLTPILPCSDWPYPPAPRPVHVRGRPHRCCSGSALHPFLLLPPPPPSRGT